MRLVGSSTAWLGLLLVAGTAACSTEIADDDNGQPSLLQQDAQGEVPASRMLSASPPGTMLRAAPRVSNGVASFTGIGDLRGGAFASAALDVSGDGSVVVGSGTARAGQRAIRWTPGRGIASLGGTSREARAVSAAGNVIAGSVTDAQGQSRAAEWVAGDGPRLLEFSSSLLIAKSSALGISGDGNLIVGSAEQVGAGPVGTTWRQGSLDHLGAPYSFITAASTDGSIVVGYRTMQRYATDRSAYYGGSPLPFPEDPECGEQSCRCEMLADCTGQALDVSADGRVVVGSMSHRSTGTHAARWIVHEGGEFEAVLLGRDAEALGVSHDGKAVVGYERDGAAERAMRWSEDGSARAVADLLAEAGLDLGGWVLTRARATSANGRVIVGEGTNPGGSPEGWVAVLP